MAGFRVAGASLVNRVVHIYAMLAMMSLGLAGLWHVLSLPVVKPQTFPLVFYQHVLGELDGRACPSYPVCSAYAHASISQHGLLLGSWLAMDRLIHEAGDVHGEHIIVMDGEKRFYDPLKRNDFWLHSD